MDDPRNVVCLFDCLIMTEKTDPFGGYDREDFQLEGIDCILVKPKTAAAGNPWIWRARFWGAWPVTELALLEKGFHVAYIDVADLFGSPKAITRFDLLYKYLTTERCFSAKPALMGFSRGGLIIYNWAAKNTDKVSCLYADAPVLDVKSWPGGKGKGPGNPDSWGKCLQAYEMTEELMMQWDGNPMDHIDTLVKAGIPVIHVCGDRDEPVPFDENSEPFIKAYRQRGGVAELIVKEGVGHHPHCLEDPAPMVEFILKYMVG